MSIKYFIACFVVLASVVYGSPERMYVEMEEVNSHQSSFHVHIGNNLWIQTNSLHRDPSGLYTYENDISYAWDNETLQMAYEKMWKCPYCFNYWKIGQRCQNSSCPSKYL